MSHGLFVAGFLSDPWHVKCTTDQLEEHYGQAFTGVTFREAMEDRQNLVKQVEEADRVVTHSAGYMPTLRAVNKYAPPAEIIAVAPPRSRNMLTLGASAIGHYFITKITGGYEKYYEATTCENNCGETGELSSHFVANAKLLPELTRFDAFDSTVKAVESNGIEASTIDLVFTEGDHLSRYSEKDKERAAAIGVEVVKVALRGHAAFYYQPKAVMEAYEAAKQASEPATLTETSTFDLRTQHHLSHKLSPAS